MNELRIRLSGSLAIAFAIAAVACAPSSTATSTSQAPGQQTGTASTRPVSRAWQSTLHELIATKHNALCDIGSQGTKGTDADLQKKFGQLCDKMWASQ
jgi:hypothetical protein